MKIIKMLYKLGWTAILSFLLITQLWDGSDFYVLQFHSVADQTFEIIQKKHPTLRKYLSAESCESYNGYFSHIVFSFFVEEEMERPEAIAFLDQFYQIFFKLCSENPPTKEYIEKFGMSNRNIRVTFYFEQEEGKPVYDPYVGILRADCGHDIIHCFDPVTQSYDCEVVIHETIDAKAFL